MKILIRGLQKRGTSCSGAVGGISIVSELSATAGGLARMWCLSHPGKSQLLIKPQLDLGSGDTSPTTIGGGWELPPLLALSVHRTSVAVIWQGQHPPEHKQGNGPSEVCGKVSLLQGPRVWNRFPGVFCQLPVETCPAGSPPPPPQCCLPARLPPRGEAAHGGGGRCWAGVRLPALGAWPRAAWGGGGGRLCGCLPEGRWKWIPLVVSLRFWCAVPFSVTWVDRALPA